MKKIKYIGTIITFNYFLSSCSFIFKPNADISQNIKQQETNIEDLLNGNYRYCSDPNPYPEDEPDVHRYCFTFTKTGEQVIGIYLYRAPKDTPYICIEGISEDNLVNGFGYESIGPSSDPYTEKDFSYLDRLPINNYLSYWDEVEPYQGGLNLKVGNPSLYKLSPPSDDKYTSYWATIRYKNAQLDLSSFEQVKVTNLPQYAECIN